MPFSDSVRDEALVLTARHCSVCHRYKGIKVEVHHIVPEADGGLNALSNAIVLCFDCHTDAGHYNPRHPKGKKFSPRELRKHRSAWHEIVRKNAIQISTENNNFHCRYLISRHFGSVHEIANGNLSVFPIENPLLVQNDVLRFQRKLLTPYREPSRGDQIFGNCYGELENYQKQHPGAHRLKKPGLKYPGFEYSRTPEVEEIVDRLSKEDPISAMLLDNGVKPHEITEALVYNEVCGGGGYSEIYRIRPLWACYLAITNFASQAYRLRELLGEMDSESELNYRPLDTHHDNNSETMTLPAMSIPPGHTVVVPIATILSPLQPVSADPYTYSEKYRYTTEGQTQSFDRCAVEISTGKNFHLIGPSFWPQQCVFQGESNTSSKTVHNFDPDNLYIVDRFWECGSCPHAFFVNSSETKIFEKTLFANTPGVLCREELVAPENSIGLIIAELEFETTTLREVIYNSEVLVQDLKLRRNEFLRIPVRPGDRIKVAGLYFPDGTISSNLASPWYRNQILSNFISLPDNNWIERNNSP